MRNNRNRKKYAKYRPILLLAAVALLLCVWSSVFSLTSAKDPLRGLTVSLSRPLTTLFDRMGGGIASVIEATTNDYENWKNEKAALEATIAEQQAALAELQEIKHQNEQLTAYLGLIEARRELTFVQTNVIYTADTTARLLTVNVGRRDGVEVGMPVVSAQGLVGRVSEVSRGTAKVSTLYDELVSVGVKNARSGVGGVLCGASDDGELCTLRYLDPNIDVTQQLLVGDILVTSGASEHYPEGILVGTITKVGIDPYDHSPYAYVKLTADVKNTSALLMVVTGEREAELPEDDLPEDDLPEDDVTEGDEPTTENEPVQDEQQPTESEPTEGEPLDEQPLSDGEEVTP